MIQTAKQETWVDAAGIAVPYSRVTKSERNKEASASRLIKSAQNINGLMVAFKQDIQKASQDFFAEVLKEHGADKRERKGNYTWYNFDKSIRVEVNATERVEFKSPEIGLAKEKLESFISDGLSNTDQFIQELVNDAFQNTKGALDPKKVLGLLRYRGKTKSAKFHEALDLIEKSIERNSSKTYYKIAIKRDNGEYEYVKLNFSDI
ncbi:MAG: DUF3164 family protein [Bacteroidia bacterium]|nr:DUF3164 family protein [Bacteroidia bacterium]